MKSRIKGQVSVAAVSGVLALFASIAAPVVYVNNIKEVNAVQDEKIGSIDIRVDKLEGKLDSLATKDDLDRLYKQQEGILKALRSNPSY
jgi:hypothetical protein